METFDLDEARRLSALGVCDERTMIPAGLVPIPWHHPFWPSALARLEQGQPLDEPTWRAIETALDPAHPWWDDMAPHLLEREGWRAKHADWAAQAAAPRPPGRMTHGGS